MSSDRRAHLIDTALRLFKKDGYHATGIDRILAESGVAKMTLYNHFKSKEELIKAALQRCDAEHRAWLVREVEQRAKSPRRQLLALFDAYEGWFRESFEGCAFIKAACEYSPPGDPIHQVAKEHKGHLLEYIRELCAKAGARQPDVLARQLFLLLEGALVTAFMNDDASSARAARAAAETLMASMLPANKAA